VETEFPFRLVCRIPGFQLGLAVGLSDDAGFGADPDCRFAGVGALSFSRCQGAVGGRQVYKNCSFQIANSHPFSDINCGGISGGAYYNISWDNCTVKFAAVWQTVCIVQCRFDWSGGSVLAGGTTPTGLFTFIGDGGVCDIAGVDFSNLDTGFNLFVPTAHPAKVVIRNCKLPSGWTGILGVPTAPSQRYVMYNCDAGDTNYKLWVSDYAGSVRDETTIVRTGGASDGTTALSWNMTSSADAEYPVVVLRAPEIVIWNETTGSAKTVTVEIVTDNVTLTDAEAWIEVQYLGTTGFPLALFASDSVADVLATPANQTTSTETWTTTGLTTPVKQKLAVTFTPQEKGFFGVTPCLAKASTTMYVCPKLTVA